MLRRSRRGEKVQFPMTNIRHKLHYRQTITQKRENNIHVFIIPPFNIRRSMIKQKLIINSHHIFAYGFLRRRYRKLIMHVSIKRTMREFV